MRIRLKLLTLLLVIALVPLAAVTWYDLQATRDLGQELSRRAQATMEERAARQLLLSARASAELLLRERKLLQAAVQLQAQAVEAALAKPPPPDGLSKVLSERPSGRLAQGVTSDGIAVDASAIAVAVGAKVSPTAAPPLLARLGGLVADLARLRGEYAPKALWQHVVLDNGARAVYPAHDQAFGDHGQEDWYRRVIETERPLVLPPRHGPLTGTPTVTAAAPVRVHSGEIAGATAIEAPLAALLSQAAATPFKPTRVLIADPIAGPGEEQGIHIVAERRGDGIAARDEFLSVRQAPGLGGVLADMTAGRAGVRRLSLAGEDAMLAYAGIEDFGTHLLLVVPYHEIVADGLQAQDYVAEQLAHQRAVLWAAPFVLVPILVALALFASRAVTKPVNQLAQAARQLAKGDFAARTHIRSGDELEELGKLFNVMVPQLETSIRMRDSLELAQEVQQNLLPRQVPQVAGLDIHGLSLYCDETGGDYYDFMPLPGIGPGAVAIMIGDVAGHGVAAALLMTTARALLRSREARPGRLAEKIGEVNRHLCRDAHGGRFMTLFLAVLDADAQRINWVGAGHGPGFIYDPGQDSFVEISGPDIPMGVDPGWHYEELSHTGWSPGTVLLVATDGVWETRNPEGAMFGKEAVWRVIRANSRRSAAGIAEAVTDALRQFRGGLPQIDDVTLVVVKAV